MIQTLLSRARRVACAGGWACGLACGAGAAGQTTPMIPAAPQAEARFGASVAGVRDLNGDTRGDVLIGAPLEDLPNGFVNCGRVFVYHGTSGALLRTIDPPNRQPNGNFGWSVAGLDNINGDTLGDFIVGAPREHPGTTPLNAGRAYVFNGANGALIRAVKSPMEQAGSLFGWSVAAVPDVNGDGRTDYLVSAPGERVGTRDGAGRVYLFSGQTGVLLRIFFSPVFEENGNYGWSVAGVPDVNGDGRGDVLIGAPREDPGTTPTDAGRVYLYSGATGALLRVFASPNQRADGHFGWSVSGIPDLNGDARGDIVIGAPGDAPGVSPARSGRAYVYSGATGVFLRTLFSPNNQLNGEFGRVVVGLMDATHDGRGEVIVSAPGEKVGTLAGAGRVYVYNGATFALFRALESPNVEAGAQFGAAAAAVPDVNFNATGEVLAGAPLENPGTAPANSGRAYLFRN